MLRRSEDNSSGQSSSPEHLQAQFPDIVDKSSDTLDEATAPSRAQITEAERAQIWAALSAKESKSSDNHGGGGGVHKDTSIRTLHTVPSQPTFKTSRDSKSKRLRDVIRRIFMNDEKHVSKNKRDSWDDIYRNKDNAKIRPIHEEYGVL